VGGALVDVEVRNLGRSDDGLHGRSFFSVEDTSARDVDELEDGFLPSDGLVGDDVVDAVLVQVVLEIGERKPAKYGV